MSNLRQSSNAGKIESLKPGDALQVLVQEVDEDNRRMTLAPPDQKSSGNWKQFAKSTKGGSSFGSMESILRAALDKKK
jgi:small subunit ribosomal protein S1